MALRDEEIALEQRRKKSAKKKLATMEVPAPKANNGKKRDSLPKGSFLEAVSAAMDNPNNTTTNSNSNGKPKKKKQTKEAVRQTDDSSGADQLSQPRKTKKVRSPRVVPPPPPPPPGSPPKQQQQRQKPAVEKQQRQKPAAVVKQLKPSPDPAPKTKAAKPSKKKDKTNRSAADTTATTSKAKAKTPDTTTALAPPPTVTGESFLQSVIAANNARKAKELHAEIADDDDDLVDSEEEEESPKKSKKKKKGKLPKLSFERQQSLQEELAKRRVENKKKRRDYVEDDAVQAVGWFSMTVKENTKEEPGLPKDDDIDNNKKKKKPRKQLRTTVDYSRNYNFITKDEIKQAKPGYYLDMVTVKKIHFDIHNLVLEPKPLMLLNDKDKTNNPNRKRVYQLDADTLQEVVDRKEDKWWIKSRLPAYVDDDEDDEEEGDSEKGMEALSIFFGPNNIDNAPDEKDADIFSIASVESVHFSDDEGENEKYFHGVARETVEVMPGEFTILRKEDETHEAIAEGTYIESLCLGCGKALLSVQDAVQVACPSCGSITPLNAICLHRPFGIATGVPAAKVKDKLAPRKSPFDSDPSKQNRPPTRKVVTAVSTRWITKEPTTEAPPAAARPEPPALANGIPNTIVTFPEDEMSQLTPMPTRPQPAAPAPPPPAPPRKLPPQEAAARRRQRPSEPQQYARKPAPTQDQQRRKAAATAPKPKSAAKQMKSAIANAVRGTTKTSKQSSKQQQRTKPAMPVAAR